MTLIEQAVPADSADAWRHSSNETLVEHLLTRYHDTHRKQLPALLALSQRVERVHGGHPECPAGLSAHLEHMQTELFGHMQKEEEILFPMILRGMGPMASGPVSVMRHEHDDHDHALKTLRSLARDFNLPQGACSTWQSLYQGLTELEADLLSHIKLENEVLFARIDRSAGGNR